MSCSEIRILLRRATRQLAFMMDHNMVYKTMPRYQAKARIEQLLTVKEADLYKSISQSRADLVEIMPPAAGRYQNLRKKLLALLDEADEKSKATLKISDFAIGV